MKWLIFLFLFLLLCACHGESVEEFKIERHPIKEQSGAKFSELTKEINQRRIDAVLDNEIESVNVYDGFYKSKLQDEEEIAKFRKFFSENELGEEREFSPDTNYLLEVNCKGKEPVYFKMLGNSVCRNSRECDLFGERGEWDRQVGSEKVVTDTMNDDSIYYKTWADEIEEEAKEENLDSDVLDIVLYVDEWNENSVIQGGLALDLVESSYYFHCSDGFCSDSYDQNLKVERLIDDKKISGIFYPKSTVEKIGNDKFIDKHEFIVPNNLIYHDVLNVYQRVGAVGNIRYLGDYLILDEKTNENKKIYKIMKYRIDSSYDAEGTLKNLIYDNGGHYFIIDLEEDIETVILENQSLLNHYEVVLEDGKMKSMKLVYTPEELSLKPLDANEEAFYLKDGSGVVNFNTVDAIRFNSRGGQAINKNLLRHKTNIYDHYLSVLVRYDDITNAYVFDIKTGSLVSDDELIAAYQIDKDKITKTVCGMYNNCEENFCLNYERYDWWGLENNTIFISSSGKPTVVLNNIAETDVLIMEWEEVQ